MSEPSAQGAPSRPGPLDQHPDDARRRRLHEIVFEADTREGWLFDVAVISLILASIAVTMELTRARDLPVSTQACPSCGIGGHEFGAKFCRRCGGELG